MKKVNFKKVFLALTVMLTFLFLGVEQAGAQSNTLTSSQATPGVNKTLMAPLQGNFVSVDEALVILQARLEEIKDDITTGGLPQSAINALMNEARYHTLILEQLMSGGAVPQSIVSAAITINSDQYGVSQPVAQSLKQQAVNLLKV